MRTIKDGTREERIAKVKRHLKMNGALIVDGALLMRTTSLCKMYGLEDMRISEVTELIKKAHHELVLEIAEWSLQFPADERCERIADEVTERLNGEYNYDVDVEICNLAYTLALKA